MPGNAEAGGAHRREGKSTVSSKHGQEQTPGSSRGAHSSTARTDPDTKCSFCHKGDDVLMLGKLYVSSKKIAAHHKCLLFSSGTIEGPKSSGEFGSFDVKTVMKEIKRGKRIKCSKCRNQGGTIGCEIKKCSKTYHYVCGKMDCAKIIENSSKGIYKLYCKQHRGEDGHDGDDDDDDDLDNEESDGSSKAGGGGGSDDSDQQHPGPGPNLGRSNGRGSLLGNSRPVGDSNSASESDGAGENGSSPLAGTSGGGEEDYSWSITDQSFLQYDDDDDDDLQELPSLYTLRNASQQRGVDGGVAQIAPPAAAETSAETPVENVAERNVALPEQHQDYDSMPGLEELASLSPQEREEHRAIPDTVKDLFKELWLKFVAASKGTGRGGGSNDEGSVQWWQKECMVLVKPLPTAPADAGGVGGEEGRACCVDARPGTPDRDAGDLDETLVTPEDVTSEHTVAGPGIAAGHQSATPPPSPPPPLHPQVPGSPQPTSGRTSDLAAAAAAPRAAAATEAPAAVLAHDSGSRCRGAGWSPGFLRKRKWTTEDDDDGGGGGGGGGTRTRQRGQRGRLRRQRHRRRPLSQAVASPRDPGSPDNVFSYSLSQGFTPSTSTQTSISLATESPEDAGPVPENKTETQEECGSEPGDISDTDSVASHSLLNPFTTAALVSSAALATGSMSTNTQSMPAPSQNTRALPTPPANVPESPRNSPPPPMILPEHPRDAHTPRETIAPGSSRNSPSPPLTVPEFRDASTPSLHLPAAPAHDISQLDVEYVRRFWSHLREMGKVEAVFDIISQGLDDLKRNVATVDATNQALVQSFSMITVMGKYDMILSTLRRDWAERRWRLEEEGRRLQLLARAEVPPARDDARGATSSSASSSTTTSARRGSHRRCDVRCCAAPCPPSLCYDVPRWTNPLRVPLLHGFQRLPSTSQVCYRAPCGRLLSSADETRRFLADSGWRRFLCARLFSFNPSVDVSSEPNPALLPADNGTGPGCCPAALRLLPPGTGLPQLLVEDLSAGSEKHVTVPCVNSLGLDAPEPFLYRWRPSCGSMPGQGRRFCVSCDCADDCGDAERCACRRLSASVALEGGSSTGYVHGRLLGKVLSGIYECNARCACNRRGRAVLAAEAASAAGVETGVNAEPMEVDEEAAEEAWRWPCENRVVGDGLRVRLQVFRTRSPGGWGVRCVDDLDVGAFVCVHAGVMEESHATRQGSASPKDGGHDVAGAAAAAAEAMPGRGVAGPGVRRILGVAVSSSKGCRESLSSESEGEHFGYQLDTREGSVGRFMNHSSSPNMFIQEVFVDTHDPRFPWLALFTHRFVRAGEELTWDYSCRQGASTDSSVATAAPSPPQPTIAPNATSDPRHPSSN
ncbi:uncharacterized protein LOC144947055 isoform X1 [Lampetra fluviatilis]